MTDRRRNSLILLLVAGLVIASLIVVAGIPGAVKPVKTRLGLDLRGGVELVYEGKPTRQSQVNTDSLNRAIDIMRQRVDQLGVAEPELQRSGAAQIVVDLPAVRNAARAQAQVGKVGQMYFYDWEPNVVGPTGKPDPANFSVTGGPNAGSLAAGLPLYQAVMRAIKRPRVDAGADTTNGTWYQVDDKTQSVVRGPEDTQADLQAEGTAPPGSRPVEVPPGTVVVKAERPPGTPRATPDRYYVLQDAPALKGTDITNPQQSFDNGAGGTGAPIVTFGFSDHGKSVWSRVTKEIAQRGASFLPPLGVSCAGANSPCNQHFAVVLDGALITTPYIDFHQNPDGIDPSNGSQIEGGFTIDSAQNLAHLLQSGALPIGLKLISQSQVSATLGKQALNQGLIAGLVGLLVVCLFLIAFYRVLGLIAVGALAVYALYFFALIKLIPITLTLPGIAGLILTIGVAADANVVIFERVKEEIRAGKSVAAGIAAGYKRGFAAIVDANVVTFMTAFILFVLATAGVKGFALTLGIGTMVSLLTAVLATQAVLGSMGRSRLISSPVLLGARPTQRRWTYDFMGASRWFFSLSGTILLVGALAIGGKGLNLGIDFVGGTRIQTALSRPATENQVRTVLQGAGVTDAQIQKVSSKDIGGTGFQISTKTLQPDRVTQIKGALDQRFVTRNFSNTSIGETFGQTVANSAVIAIIASLIVISLYIALRFEWKYAVPVLIALMHDLLITAGVYSLTGREVTTSTVAALLTILGYSLYDTIIVFDRVRENVPRMPRAAFSQIVNRSMSEVLTRSLATSFCTLLPVASLLLFGGATLKDFAFALLVGVASGAYSSIFIASPVLTHWKEREPVYRARRTRIAAANAGVVPAYALTSSGTQEDIAPPEPRRPRRPTVLAPDEETVSASEFQEMVRELHVDDPAATPARGSAEDARPEDVVMPKDRPIDGSLPRGGRSGAKRRGRNRRHGRSR